MKKVLATTLLVIAILVVLVLGISTLLGQNKTNQSVSTGNTSKVSSIGKTQSGQCYLYFWIDGRRTSNGVSLKLATNGIQVVNARGYNALVRPYTEGDHPSFVIHATDAKGKVIGEYNLYMSFALISEFSPEYLGKVIPQTDASVSSTILYDPRITQIIITEGVSSKQAGSFPVVIDKTKIPFGCAD